MAVLLVGGTMSEIGITAGLVVAFVGLGWLIYRVVGTLSAGGENSARADTNAAGASPGSDHIDSAMVQAKSERRAIDQ